MINQEEDLELSIISLSAYNVPPHIIANMIDNLNKVASHNHKCLIIEDYEQCDLWKCNPNGCRGCKYK